MHKGADAVATLRHAKQAHHRHVLEVGGVVLGMGCGEGVVDLQLLEHCLQGQGQMAATGQANEHT